MNKIRRVVTAGAAFEPGMGDAIEINTHFIKPEFLGEEKDGAADLQSQSYFSCCLDFRVL